MNIEKEFIEFRNLTLELIDRVKIQGNRLNIIKKRQEVLNRIMSSNYDSEELRKIALKLGIFDLENELHNKINDEMNTIKKKIHELKRIKQGNQAYIMNGYGGYVSSTFDKKY